MTGIVQTLAIIGAAEGSNYIAGSVTIDVRYKPSFANAKSGLSFGAFQFDVATKPQGQATFRDILRQGVSAAKIDQAASNRLFASASTRNAGAVMTKDDKAIVTTLMGTTDAKRSIDSADQQRAMSVASLVDGMIARAATCWAGKGISGAAILTPGQPSCLDLFAYILASLNRYPANQRTFETWLQGGMVKTLNGPPGGFQLTAPPTLPQMHAFFHSLRIWDGTQGNDANLRARLDPTLARIGG